MTRGPSPRRSRGTFTGRLAGSLILLLGVVGTVVILMTAYAVQRENENALANSRHLAETAVNLNVKRLGRLVTDYAYWNATRENVIEGLNSDWADDNIGIYTFEAFGVNESFAVAANGETRYAMVHGERERVDAGEFLGGNFDLLLRKARAVSKIKPEPVTAFVLNHGIVHLIAAAAITPEEETAAMAYSQPRGVLIYGQEMNEEFLSELADDFLLRGLRLTGPDAGEIDASVPLADFDGKPIMYLTWDVPEPGAEFGKLVMPLILMAFLVVGASTWMIVNRAQSATHEIEGVAASLAKANQGLREREETANELRRQAQLANRAKTEFLANMSHELHTPLNSIIGYSELIGDDIHGSLGDPRYVEYAENINQSGAHLLQVIGDILDVSKVEIGELDVVDEQVEVGEAVEFCVRMLAERAVKERLSITTEMADGLPRLRADGRRVKQILLNLLTNAVKFTPPDGRITVTACLDGGKAIMLAVKDTGIGIRAEDIPKALDPFSQVDNIMKQTYEGSELGLFLVKSLTEMHGGTLKMESEPSEGTTVTVTFPPERSIPVS